MLLGRKERGGMGEVGRQGREREWGREREGKLLMVTLGVLRHAFVLFSLSTGEGTCNHPIDDPGFSRFPASEVCILKIYRICAH